MKVTWNSDSYAQFLQPTFDIKPDLKITLLHDFTSLKQGMYPAVFGKDGPYTAPGAIVSSRVYHVHLLFTKQERTSNRNRFNCTSDRALVYSQHAHFQDVYSLLAIFPNNAHQYAKDPKIMA
ncbi:TPA: type II toxin-antitoxin system YafO family toxin, partial [Citrobacter freundii]